MTGGAIVSADALRDGLDSNDSLVLLDARTDRASYDAGHLPGARFADSDTQLSSAGQPSADPVHGGRHPLPDLEQWCRTVGEWGITPSTNVVVYDDQEGAIAATRAWWMLRAIGHERVAVLDGGLASAVAAGIPLTTASPVVSPQPPYPARGWSLSLVDIDAVDQLRTDPAWRVLDVRSAPRFAGKEEPLDPIAGHIPGAVNLPYPENLAGGTFKAPDELRAMYEKLLAGTSADHLVVHCGSGVTACHTLLALEIAGMHGASLYVGGWSEWCRSPRPRATDEEG
ncbi:MAG: sulfurtransferase [Thermoanaerobaculia bacterium]